MMKLENVPAKVDAEVKAAKVAAQLTVQASRVGAQYEIDVAPLVYVEDKRQYIEGISAIDDVNNYSPLTDWIAGIVPPLAARFQVPNADDDLNLIAREVSGYLKELQIP
jgi:hypothetical protein